MNLKSGWQVEAERLEKERDFLFNAVVDFTVHGKFMTKEETINIINKELMKLHD